MHPGGWNADVARWGRPLVFIHCLVGVFSVFFGESGSNKCTMVLEVRGEWNCRQKTCPTVYRGTDYLLHVLILVQVIPPTYPV